MEERRRERYSKMDQVLVPKEEEGVNDEEGVQLWSLPMVRRSLPLETHKT